MRSRTPVKTSVVAVAVLAPLLTSVLCCNGTLHFGASSDDQLTVDAAAPPADAAIAIADASTCSADDACTTAGLTRCDPILRTCVACESADDCASGQACNLYSHTCAQSCAEGPSEHDCPSSAPTCNEKALYCVACASDIECGEITDDGEHCNADSGKCVECLSDQDCPADGHCDLAESTCE